MAQEKSLDELIDYFKANSSIDIQRDIALQLNSLIEQTDKSIEANHALIERIDRILTPKKSQKSHKNPCVHDLEIDKPRKKLNLRLRALILVIVGVLTSLALYICAFIALPYVTQ
jgi:hypothetical protein